MNSEGLNILSFLNATSLTYRVLLIQRAQMRIIQIGISKALKTHVFQMLYFQNIQCIKYRP